MFILEVFIEIMEPVVDIRPLPALLKVLELCMYILFEIAFIKERVTKFLFVLLVFFLRLHDFIICLLKLFIINPLN